MKPKDTVFFLTDVCVLRISRALEPSSENSKEGCNAHYPITDTLSCPTEIQMFSFQIRERTDIISGE